MRTVAPSKWGARWMKSALCFAVFLCCGLGFSTASARGTTTIGVYRTIAYPGYLIYEEIFLRNSNTYGAADIGQWYPIYNGYTLVVGDWGGVGHDEIGVYGQNTFALPVGPAFGGSALGDPGDLPVVGDWDGNGTTTVGVYRPSTNTFYLRNSITYGAPDIVVPFGDPGDIPVVGDWDGNGTTTIGLYRPSINTFYLRNSNTYGAPDIVVPFGDPGDIPVVGDWDGNGTTTIGLYRPSTNTFYLRNSNTYGAPDIVVPFGAPGDLPLVGDWDGK